MNFGWIKIGIFQKNAHKKSEWGSLRSDLKNSTPSLGNVEKPPHPQLSAQRACEG